MVGLADEVIDGSIVGSMDGSEVGMIVGLRDVGKQVGRFEGIEVLSMVEETVGSMDGY